MMMSRLLIATLLSGTCLQAAFAAEIHLRRECQSSGALVTLGDVADIFAQTAVEKSQLAGIELFPAPSAAASRLVRAREIQDVLSQRGVDLRRNRLAGASAVNIFGPPQSSARESSRQDGWKTGVESRIAEYLRQQADANAAWQVSLDGRSEQRLPAVHESAEVVSVSGGRSPWVGSQQFVVQIRDGNTSHSVVVTALVTRPVGMVVPIRPLAQGEIIQASDLQIQPSTGRSGNVEFVSHIDQVVGNEAVRSLAAGRPLQRIDVRLPNLVKRNSNVTVIARARGLQVRTSAKAMEDGARDDLIKVQSLLDRDEQFIARVVGYKEVEVFAGPPTIESPTAPTTQEATTVRPVNRLGATQQRSLFGLRVQGSVAGD